MTSIALDNDNWRSSEEVTEQKNKNHNNSKSDYSLDVNRTALLKYKEIR